MTTYLKGSKRLAIIHRWLQGIDDPNYEVLPTRKEGKYIVKKRQQTEEVTQESTTETIAEPIESTTESTAEESAPDTTADEPAEQAHSKPAPSKQAPSKPAPSKQAPSKQAPRKQAPSKQAPSKPAPVNTYDPTINLEILEQLKLLGDEIRSKRERKQQKQLINHVIDKRMSKRQLIPQAKQIEQEYYSEEEEQQQPQYVFKSRIRR